MDRWTLSATVERLLGKWNVIYIVIVQHQSCEATQQKTPVANKSSLSCQSTVVGKGLSSLNATILRISSTFSWDEAAFITSYFRLLPFKIFGKTRNWWQWPSYRLTILLVCDPLKHVGHWSQTLVQGQWTSPHMTLTFWTVLTLNQTSIHELQSAKFKLHNALQSFGTSFQHSFPWHRSKLKRSLAKILYKSNWMGLVDCDHQ